MNGFIDIHSHILCGVDDGAPSTSVMLEMLKIAYDDGIRGICVTPHYENPMVAAVDEKKSFSEDEAYRLLQEAVKKSYPDMKLWRGNEIFYHHDCVENLESGKCFSLGGGRHVLVEFFLLIEGRKAIKCLQNFLNSGYIPVLAHVERYDFLRKKFGYAEMLSDIGVKLQVNAASVLGAYGSNVKRYVHKLIRHGLVDIISSDAHNSEEQSPRLSECYEYVCKKYGENVAERLFRLNALDILAS